MCTDCIAYVCVGVWLLSVIVYVDVDDEQHEII